MIETNLDVTSILNEKSLNETNYLRSPEFAAVTLRRPSSSPRVCTDEWCSHGDVITKFSRLNGLYQCSLTRVLRSHASRAEAPLKFSALNWHTLFVCRLNTLKLVRRLRRVVSTIGRNSVYKKQVLFHLRKTFVSWLECPREVTGGSSQVSHRSL